jgi:hypothetical protein
MWLSLRGHPLSLWYRSSLGVPVFFSRSRPLKPFGVPPSSLSLPLSTQTSGSRRGIEPGFAPFVCPCSSRKRRHGLWLAHSPQLSLCRALCRHASSGKPALASLAGHPPRALSHADFGATHLGWCPQTPSQSSVFFSPMACSVSLPPSSLTSHAPVSSTASFLASLASGLCVGVLCT